MIDGDFILNNANAKDICTAEITVEVKSNKTLEWNLLCMPHERKETFNSFNKAYSWGKEALAALCKDLFEKVVKHAGSELDFEAFIRDWARIKFSIR